MLPRSVVSGTTASVGVSVRRELIKVAIRHAQQIRRSARKANRSLLPVRGKSGPSSKKKEKTAGPLTQIRRDLCSLHFAFFEQAFIHRAQDLFLSLGKRYQSAQFESAFWIV